MRKWEKFVFSEWYKNWCPLEMKKNTSNKVNFTLILTLKTKRLSYEHETNQVPYKFFY